WIPRELRSRWTADDHTLGTWNTAQHGDDVRMSLPGHEAPDGQQAAHRPTRCRRPLGSEAAQVNPGGDEAYGGRTGAEDSQLSHLVPGLSNNAIDLPS